MNSKFLEIAETAPKDDEKRGGPVNLKMSDAVKQHMSEVNHFMDHVFQLAIADDGVITRREKKVLRKLEACSRKYLNALIDAEFMISDKDTVKKNKWIGIVSEIDQQEDDGEPHGYDSLDDYDYED